MKDRIKSNRFIFDYEYYMSDEYDPQRMLHLTLLSKGPMYTELWLDEDDQKKLKEVLKK